MSPRKRRTLADDLRDLEASDPAIAEAGARLDALGDAIAAIAASRSLVQVGPASDAAWRVATPDDYEDIDALPVKEQAAIVCAIFASDPCNRYEWVDVVECRKVHGRWYPTGEDAQIACGCLVITAHPWAEAEARIRNGEAPRG